MRRALLRIDAGADQRVEPVTTSIASTWTRTRCDIASCTESPETGTDTADLIRIDVPASMAGNTVAIAFDGPYFNRTFTVPVTADACAAVPTLYEREVRDDRCGNYPGCMSEEGEGSGSGDGDDGGGGGCSVPTSAGLLAAPALAMIIGAARRRRRATR